MFIYFAKLSLKSRFLKFFILHSHWNFDVPDDATNIIFIAN